MFQQRACGRNDAMLRAHMTRLQCARALLLVGALLALRSYAGESICYGTVAQGRLENGVALPESGANFAAYSRFGARLGRTYVHSTVLDVVVAAYHELERTAPGQHFVYGETGWRNGGRIRPYRTHQNGLSVDFFVPVRDAAGHPATLPSSVTNRFGYDVELDAQGRYEDLAIDYAALAEHLFQLQSAAQAREIDIERVIFERAFLPRLFATPRGEYLRRHVPFMQETPWIRHDEHYHVDFALPCKK